MDRNWKNDCQSKTTTTTTTSTRQKNKNKHLQTIRLERPRNPKTRTRKYQPCGLHFEILHAEKSRRRCWKWSTRNCTRARDKNNSPWERKERNTGKCHREDKRRANRDSVKNSSRNPTKKKRQNQIQLKYPTEISKHRYSYLHVYEAVRAPGSSNGEVKWEEESVCSLFEPWLYSGGKIFWLRLTDEGPPLTYTLTADWLGTEAGWWAQATGMNIIDDDEMMERPPAVHSSVLSRLWIPPAGITE